MTATTPIPRGLCDRRKPSQCFELDALAENVLKNYAVGKLLIEGDNRYLSGDLMQFLLNLIMPYRMVSPDAVKLCRTLLDESFSGTADFYAPGAVYAKQERYTLLRNPHIARNEEAMVTPIEKVGYMRDRYLSHLTDVVMVGSTSLIPERLGGADYDGDMVKTIAEPILNDCVFQNYDTDNENITQDRARLHFENDTPEMVALMDAFINKEFGVDYRDAVAARCLDLVKKICNPSEAVKYVVALNKRSFLWDVLWEYVEKYALKR